MPSVSLLCVSMTAPIRLVKNWNLADIDQVIDVRSPREFKTDHIPGASNLYVLSDQQHEIVGRTHKRSSFEAKKLGSSYVLANISKHLDFVLRNKPKSFHPLFYCARGGQRSKSFATICAEVGWHCSILEGGYKSYRSQVLSDLESLSEKLKIIIISGRTGTGKTRILNELKKRGENIIDLEHLARHRGSLLGSRPGIEQPQQKLFETSLCNEIMGLNFENPVFVEAESSKIGNVQIPRPLWKAMRNAPQVLIKSDLTRRADYLLKDYANLKKDPEGLFELFRLLEKSGLNAVSTRCRKLVAEQDWKSLANTLLHSHYDKRYDRSFTNYERQIIMEIELLELNHTCFRSIAQQISKKKFMSPQHLFANTGINTSSTN